MSNKNVVNKLEKCNLIGEQRKIDASVPTQPNLVGSPPEIRFAQAKI